MAGKTVVATACQYGVLADKARQDSIKGSKMEHPKQLGDCDPVKKSIELMPERKKRYHKWAL